MEKLIFETNVQSPLLIQKIDLAIEKIKGIYKWQIDLDSIYNLLTIEGINLDHIEIVSQLSQYGVEASRLYEE
jgi:hypothetical protein